MVTGPIFGAMYGSIWGLKPKVFASPEVEASAFVLSPPQPVLSIKPKKSITALVTMNRSRIAFILSGS